MKNNPFLKRFLISSTLLLLLASLIACSDSTKNEDSTKGNSDSEVKELDVWLFSGMDLEDQMQEYADENGIKLNLTVLDQGDHQTNLTTALASGSGLPDITGIGGPFVENYKTNPDNFVNLQDFGVEEVEEDYLDFRWNMMMTPDGEFTIGLPTDVGPMVMVYREDIFEKAGLPVDPEEVNEQIKTWDDFIEAGEQIKSKTDKPIISSSETLFHVLIGQGEQLLFDTDNNLIVEENPQVKKAWNLISEIAEKDLSMKIDRDSSEWGAAMNNGDFAVELAPSWMLGQIKSNAPDTSGKWNVAQMPEGSGYWGGSMLAIPKGTEKAEEAYNMIKWVLSPEQQLRTFVQTSQFPSTPGIYDDAEILDYKDEFFNNAPLGSIFAEAAKKLEPVHYGPQFTDVRDILTDGATRVERNQGTPEENWQQSLEEIERTIRRR